MSFLKCSFWKKLQMAFWAFEKVFNANEINIKPGLKETEPKNNCKIYVPLNSWTIDINGGAFKLERDGTKRAV